MLRINEFKVDINEDLNKVESLLCKYLKVKKVNSFLIVKKSLDFRDKTKPIFKYTIDFSVDNEKVILKKSRNINIIEEYNYELVSNGNKVLDNPVYVIGFGPAGMIATLTLIRRGIKVVVIERGSSIEQRVKDVEDFWNKSILNNESNVQFGEGGAGTFSDGKLTTRSKDKRVKYILSILVEFGADPKIMYEAYPHIGTDKLRNIVINIRKEIIKLGGIIKFNEQLINMNIINNTITSITTTNNTYECNNVILAIGHSARDTYRMLNSNNVDMQNKSFAIGVRVEHSQLDIDKNQYGEYYNHHNLESSEYRLTYNTNNKRGVYSFCMCPGGLVVASSSEQNKVVTNGMSYNDRNLDNANSAILVQVTPEDYGNEILDGIKLQEQLEEKAFILGGSNYYAPCTNIKDYINNIASTTYNKVKPTYLPGVKYVNLNELFPSYINESLKEAFINFDKKIKGFIDNGIMTGVETRSSSPIRINRNEQLQSTNIIGLYPCGEGAGYAGGIISAALDGLKCSEKIIEEYN